VIRARGELRLGDFTLTARADRLERHADGGIAVIDYKSGRLPSGPQVEAGFSPQLPLLGALARAGGFPDLPPGVLRELRYWSLHGAERGGLVRDALPTGRGSAGLSPDELAERALEGLRRLVAHFDDPNTPYHARPRPKFVPGFSDYDHLARVKEWAVEDEA
jgi:ATP-dependent helicase/nuclease subunit B